MEILRVRTPAKVNLHLSVLGRRSDGYHELDTLFQAIDLEDELILEKTSGPATLRVPDRPDLETADNLILRAVRLLEAETGENTPVTITLLKRVPVAGGLGGGSSDAAATLIGVSRLFDLDLPQDRLEKMALALGADVPFFLKGGTAIGRGVGEILTPVTIPGEYEMILVNPGFPLSTAAVFREFSKTLTGPPRQGKLSRMIRDRYPMEDLLHNDLQEVAERMCPEIAQVRSLLGAAGAPRSLMSGSGPTVFGLVEPGRAKSVTELLTVPLRVMVARPVDRGIELD